MAMVAMVAPSSVEQRHLQRNVEDPHQQWPGNIPGNSVATKFNKNLQAMLIEWGSFNMIRTTPNFFRSV